MTATVTTSKAAWAPTVNALLCFGDQRRYARRVLADERFTRLLEAEERSHWTGMAEAPEPIVFPPMAYLVANRERYLEALARNTRSRATPCCALARAMPSATAASLA